MLESNLSRINRSIENKLASIERVRTSALALAPDVLSLRFERDRRLPLASVCFHDCTGTLAQARYALRQYYVSGVYHRLTGSAPEETSATFLKRFYLEDAANRLYAAAEQLADALERMLEIPKAELASLKKKPSNKRSTLGKYLLKKTPTAALTQRLIQLEGSPDWQFTMAYRGDTVHEQPPTVQGLGLVFNRGSRWLVSGQKSRLDVVAGDRPRFSMLTVAKNIIAANNRFVGVVEFALDEYFAVLKTYGVRRGPKRAVRPRTSSRLTR